MFNIFKKKKSGEQVDFSGLQTDMHSHLLPGIDDGSPDAEVSLQLKKGLEDLGYVNFITTPHILWDLYKNTPETINGALNNLNADGVQSNIRPAAEYFLDEHFDELLQNKEPLMMIQDKTILVEFSFVSPPMDLKEKLFDLNIRGYQTILAHPERYTYFASRKNVFEEFRDMGCCLQLNILSLTGYYGKISQELASYMVANNLVDYLGTDLHHFRHLDALRNAGAAMPVINRLLNSGKLKNPSLRF